MATLLPPPTQLLVDQKTGSVNEAWYRFFEAVSGATEVDTALDPELQAIADLTSAANKVPYYTGSGTAAVLDFLDEDTMVSNSATAVASQQSIKAYVDAGGIKVLTGGSVSAQPSLSLALDSYTQTIFKLVLYNVVAATDNVSAWIRFSDDGGSTFEADAADYQYQYNDGSTGVVTNTGAAQIVIADSIGNATGEYCSFEITIFNPAGSAQTAIVWLGMRKNTTTQLRSMHGGGEMAVAGISTDIQFLFSTGNITSGNYTLLGIT